MDKNFYINEIISEYADNLNRQRTENEAALKKARKLPAFAALEKETAALEILCAKAEAEGLSCEKENAGLKLLYQKREKLLKDNELFIEIKYSCIACKDGGWKGKELCNCVKQKLHGLLIKEGGLPYPKAVFGKKAAEIFGENIRPEMSKLYVKLEKYCAEIADKETKSILIAGNTGVGKTHLLCCMANALMDQGCTVQFLTAFSLLSGVMLKYHNAPMDGKEALLSPLLDCDALFIDDLGAENIFNNVTMEYLYLIINERQLSGKYLFISTNLDSEQLLNRYGARIHSRLLNKSTSFFITMPGDDLRKR